jgi:hypothetical protein
LGGLRKGGFLAHGELLKLGFTVAQSTVARYMAGGGGPPSQGWGSTFLRIHAPHIAAMDLFVVPTIGFNLLYVLVLSGWLGASHRTRRQNGLRSKLLRHSPGMRRHVT